MPSFLTAYRRDVVATIGGALLGAAAGRGHRPLAAAAAVPASTGRGWIRRARRYAAPSRARLWRYAFELEVRPSRTPQIRSAGSRTDRPDVQAATERWGTAAECPGPFQIATAVTGGRLLGPWPSELSAGPFPMRSGRRPTLTHRHRECRLHDHFACRPTTLAAHGRATLPRQPSAPAWH